MNFWSFKLMPAGIRDIPPGFAEAKSFFFFFKNLALSFSLLSDWLGMAVISARSLCSWIHWYKS